MKFAVMAAGLLLAGTIEAVAGTKNVSLAPVPYEIRLPEAIADNLAVEAGTGPWADDLKKGGGDAVSVVFYKSANGGRAVLMSVYLFPEEKFDAAKNPDEPPAFGREVIRSNGKVLSVAGPQDTIFDPETVDGKNVVASNDLIYDPQNYTPTE